MNDRHVALIVDFLQRLDIRPECQLAIDGQYLVFRDMNSGPIIPIQGITIGNYGIEVIVSPG